MEQISFFHRGINTDLDYSKMLNDGLLLPTANIQLVNKEGQGMILTPVKGTQELFEISEGFYIIGACEYNGIAYIASHNPQTGMGELGSFPRPSNPGFVNEYKPLYDWNVEQTIEPEEPEFLGGWSIPTLNDMELIGKIYNPVGEWNLPTLADMKLIGSLYNPEGKWNLPILNDMELIGQIYNPIGEWSLPTLADMELISEL